jgi:hypothetical protein
MQLPLQGSLACLGMDLCQTACLTHALHILDFQHRPAQEVVRDNHWLDSSKAAGKTLHQFVMLSSTSIASQFIEREL